MRKEKHPDQHIRLRCLRYRPLALLIAIGFTAQLSAGKYNPTLSIGDQAPPWQQLAGVDGQQHSLRDLRKAKAIVLVFTCNSCPYAVEYEDRIIALTSEFSEQQVAIIAVNVNKGEEDSFERMAERAKNKKFNFAYIFDPSQQIARDYGATYTPEFFVLNQDRKIAYMGSLDDSPDAAKVKKRHVADALSAILNGKSVETTETAAIGCRIRMQRKRR